MELGERKKIILGAIVEEYIKTAEPIGSKTIAEKYRLGLSPATIRNEMADLEEAGFLEKPHTSAGRIPSYKAYRIYVDDIMRSYDLSNDEIENLKAAMNFNVVDIDEMIDEASAIISDIMNYTVFASVPQPVKKVIKDIELFPVGSGHILAVASLNDGTVKNFWIEAGGGTPAEDVRSISVILSDLLCGRSPHDLSASDYRNLEEITSCCQGIWKQLYDGLTEIFGKEKRRPFYTRGVVKMLNHPEYRDFERAKTLLGFFGNSKNVYDILACDDDKSNIKIAIGEENGKDELKDCSVIISSYHPSKDLRGEIGIVGPTRMDYAHVISALDEITDSLGIIIGKLLY